MCWLTHPRTEHFDLSTRTFDIIELGLHKRIDLFSEMAHKNIALKASVEIQRSERGEAGSGCTYLSSPDPPRANSLDINNIYNLFYIFTSTTT